MPTTANSSYFSMFEKHDDNNDQLLSIQTDGRVHYGVRVHAWLTLFGAWLAIAATFGYTFTFGFYQEVYTHAHVASATGIRWIGATQLSLLLLTSLPAGLLRGMGQFHSTITLGSSLFTLSLFMLSKFEPADHYFKIIYTQGIAMGVGAGLVFVPSLLVLADQWGTHSTLAMGIASSGLFAGGTFLPTILTQLLHNGVSFAWTVRASACVVVVMLLVANTCMRWACPRTSPLTGDTRMSVRELVTDAPYMCAVIGGFSMNWGIYFVYFYLQQFLIDRSIDRTFALYTPGILCGAAATGGILANLAATKCGTINVSTAMAIFCGILVTLPFIPSSIAGVTLCASIFGLFSGAWFSLLPPVIRTLSTNTRDCGVRLGIAFSVSAAAVLVGTEINGMILGSGPASRQYWVMAGKLISGMMTTGVFVCTAVRHLMMGRLQRSLGRKGFSQIF